MPPHKQRKHAGDKNAFKIEGKSNFTVKIIPNSQKKNNKNVSEMELKQLEDRKHFKILFPPKKNKYFFGGGVVKTFQGITQILKRHFYFYK